MMSNFIRRTKNPATGKFEDAEWLDNHYGPRLYGVHFPDGEVYYADAHNWEFDDSPTELGSSSEISDTKSTTDSQADDELALVKLIDDIRALQLDFNDDVPYREGIELVQAYSRRHTTEVLERLKEKSIVVGYDEYAEDDYAVPLTAIEEAIQREQDYDHTRYQPRG